MIEFGKGRLSFKDKDGWHNLGESRALVITLRDGTKIRCGDRDAIFDMELTLEDRQLLAEMKVGKP